MYYKVVNKNQTRSYDYAKRAKLPHYRSSTANSQYIIGIPTVPEFGKLFIFDSLSNARKHYDTHHTIFVCDAKNVTKCPFKYIPNFYISGECELESFWRYLYDDSSFWAVPYGTLLADSVTLLYEVA